MMAGYMDARYAPKEDDVVCTFRMKNARGVSTGYAVQQLVAESSIGTWTDIATMKPEIARKLGPKAFSLRGGVVKVAYPADDFEPGNASQIWSAVCGNIFGMKILDSLRVEDIELPKKLARSFKGPALGVPGIRRMLGVPKRPLVGTIVKPKVGLNEREHAHVAYEAWANGLDLVKDDENLCSMSFNRFEKRVVEVLKARERAERETGEKKLAVLNVSGPKMLQRAEFIREHGGNAAMVDIISCGWAGLQMLRNAETGLVMHGHRAGHAAFTRNREHGIAMMVVAKTARWCGIDTLHIGTADIGKMEGGSDEVVAVRGAIQRDEFGLKPVFAVASGGLHPALLPGVIERLGGDVVVQFGGGVHGHPRGTAAGARAVRQALDATVEGETLDAVAARHWELREALEKWRRNG
ncbi:type III ribulose-bisphosphate carboxylase [Candidatus Micrarchaeota archaeon CG08_land_8_20_14_0_20_59_11]|nr:MAG: type III ribulose-bisphosphate carboxylase [Candidatus Micrarchaeota archaeon CG08_land_8_20_14_0_20_59_11]